MTPVLKPCVFGGGPVTASVSQNMKTFLPIIALMLAVNSSVTSPELVFVADGEKVAHLER